MLPREKVDALLAHFPGTKAYVPNVRLTGPGDFERRLPGNLSVCIEGLEGEAVLIQLDLNGISASFMVGRVDRRASVASGSAG